MSDVRYKRILLKMGGEALAGQGEFGIEPQRAAEVAQVVKDVHDLGVQAALVIGGGNLWRGSVGTQYGMERSTARWLPKDLDRFSVWIMGVALPGHLTI